MILSNEPGYYKEGAFGIRIENLVYIKKNKFEELTVAPIEKDLINKNILDRKEIKWINNYHYKVKKNLYRFYELRRKSLFRKSLLTYLKSHTIYLPSSNLSLILLLFSIFF